MSAPDALTILRCAPGLHATKRVKAGPGAIEIVGFGRAKYFVATVVRFHDVHGLYRLLLRQDCRYRECVIRATLRAGIDPRRVRRTLHGDPSTGEPACFVPVARSWAAFDFDGVPEPAGIDPVREPVEAGMFLRDLLPDPFPEAACVVQATSSCGFKPGLRFRLWFVTSRPLHGREVEAWCGRPELDPATLRDVEPIYTARPILEGVADPVPRRIVLLEGLSPAVEVPDPLPQTRRVASPGPSGLGAAAPAAGFDGWLARMGDGEGLHGFRRPMFSALAAYARQHGADALADAAGDLRARIVGALAAAPKRPGRGPDLERYLAEAHHAELVGWIVGRERRRENAERAGAILAAAATGRAA